MSAFSRLLPIICLLIVLSPAPAALAVFGEDPEHDGEPILTEIEITGNEKTDRSLILREMGLTIGEPLSYEKLDAIWDHLEDIGYFSYVDIEYDDSEANEVVLRVLVEEDMTTLYGPTIRYNRRHKYYIGGWVAENNFRGKGEKLKVSLVAFYIQRGDIAWTRPWLAGVKGLELDLRVMGELANFVFRPTDYKKWNFDLNLRWKFWREFFVEGGFQYGGFETSDSYWWDAPDRGPDGPVGSVYHEAGNQNHTRLSASVGWDSRDNKWYPLRGVLGKATVATWQSQQFETYNEFSLDGRVFAPLPWDHVLALRGWARQVDGAAQMDNVLYQGGVETIRGYPFGQLEGDEGYLLTAEYRFPLFLMPISPQGEMVGFGLHAFCDAGDAWYYGADAGRRLLSWGAGAHINIDTLQLRFEAASTEDGDWMFEFADRFNF